MGKPKNTYKYVLKDGVKVVHIGITTDLQRRESEHRQQYPRSHVVQIGRRTTQEQARQWERSVMRHASKSEPKELRNLSHETRAKMSRHKDRILKTLDKRS